MKVIESFYSDIPGSKGTYIKVETDICGFTCYRFYRKIVETQKIEEFEYLAAQEERELFKSKEENPNANRDTLKRPGI